MEQDRHSYYRREREYQRRKSQIEAQRRKTLTIQAAILVVILFFICLILGDLVLDQTRMAHWLSVYGVSVSGMTVENAAQKIEKAFEKTEFRFKENGEVIYETTLGEAGFSLDGEALREELYEIQAEMAQNRGLIETPKNIEIAYTVLTDEAAFSEALSAEHFEVELERTESVDATLEYDSETGMYEIVSSWQGNVIDEEKLRAVIEETMEESFAESLIQDSITVIVDVNSYQTVNVTETSEEMTARLDEANQSLQNYQSTSIVYTFGSVTEVLDTETICSWLTITDDGVELDSSAIWTFIDELSDLYDTKYETRYFRTSDGDTVAVSNNEYGFVIDKDQEYVQLCADLESGTTIEREPIYSAEGLYRDGTDDLMGCYIEVDLDAQHLWLYKDYTLIVETDVVTGKLTEDGEQATLEGAFSIAYKASPYTLSSEYYGYETEVNYWMPFANGQGLHDATWRTSFGGTLYENYGSHGCINLPLEAAETIYNTITAGYPIIIYSRESSES